MGSIEFEVPDEFKKYGISRIFQIGPYIKTIYNDTAITANFDVAKLKPSMKNFREQAGKIITSNGVNAGELIEKLVTYIITQATNFYEQGVTQGGGVNSSNSGSAGRGGDGGSASDQKQAAVMKYTVKRAQGPAQLWETVKVGGQYHLVSYDPVQNKLLPAASEISESDRTIVPYSEGGIEPYTFQSIDELNQYIELAKAETAGTLFTEVKDWAAKFYDTDTEEYTNLIAGDIVFTYFQDRIGKTHYVFVWGDPDQGKGAILETFNQLCYRGVSVTSATAATVYRMFGSIEKGQAVLIIDEANKLEDDNFLLNVLKVGYKGKQMIPRVMDAQSSENSKIEYFYPYGFKIIAAEKLPAHWKTGGFLSRCLQIKTAPGDPQIDIGDVVDNAGDAENAELMARLEKLRKTLFAYRLLHYHEPIPDVKIKGISGRDRELTKPIIRLFKTHGGGGDSNSLDTIKQTMHYFIKERNSFKSDSLKAAILKLVKNQIELDFNNDNGKLAYKDIWSNVKEQFNGKPLEDKPDTLDTDLYGEIGSKKLAAVLRSIGGKKARDSSGDKRVWEFDMKTLDRFSRVYKEIPASIELDESELPAASSDEEDNEEEEKENNDE